MPTKFNQIPLAGMFVQLIDDDGNMKQYPITVGVCSPAISEMVKDTSDCLNDQLKIAKHGGCEIAVERVDAE